MTVIEMFIAPSTRITSEKESLYVKFDYNIEAVGIVKSLNTRFYIPEKKIWEVPIYEINNVIDKFKDFDIKMVGRVQTDVVIQDKSQENSVKFTENDLKDFKFKTKPFEHQIQGIIFGRNHPKFLLADEQGLGKTKQVIDLAVSRKGEFKHCLIVCGVNSTKHNWLREISIHSDESGHILGSYYDSKGRLKDDGPLEYRLDDLESDLDDFFLITNIETFREIPKNRKESSLSKQELTYKKILDRIEELTTNGTIGMVVIDEIHKVKNPNSRQGQAIHRLKSKYKVALTGTPIMNNPLDLYNILKWLDVEQHSFYQFKNFYCIHGGYGGYEILGYKNLAHLQNKLDSIMLRRRKEEVLDLPPKIRQTEYVEISGSQKKLYDLIRDEIINNIEEIKLSPNPLAVLTRLRQVTSYPQILSNSVKENAKMERLEELVEEITQNGHKAIIFSNWAEVTKAVKERLKKYNPAYIDGQVKDRMSQVTKFQEDESCKVIIGTIGAMGTGLTLNAASFVIFIDKPWSPADVEQAEDRAHRIGTKGTVNVITLCAKDTVDERIEEILSGKQDIVEALVERKSDKLRKLQLIEKLLS